MDRLVSESVELAKASSSQPNDSDKEESSKKEPQEELIRENDQDNDNDNDSDENHELFKGEKAFYLAKVCVHLKNFEDAIHYADEMAKLTESALSKDKISIFLEAYSLGLSLQREAWRRLNFIEKEEKVAKKMINEIKTAKEQYILKTCDRLIKIINHNILSKPTNDENTALLLKVKADHYRYMAEVTHGHTLYINKQNAFYFYKEAHEKAKELSDLNATKLNIALNYSVFLFEILNKRINSFFYAKEALYKALKALKMCNEQELTNESMRDTLMIIEVLNVNVEEWYKEEIGVSAEKTANEEKTG